MSGIGNGAPCVRPKLNHGGTDVWNSGFWCRGRLICWPNQLGGLLLDPMQLDGGLVSSLLGVFLFFFFLFVLIRAISTNNNAHKI